MVVKYFGREFDDNNKKKLQGKKPKIFIKTGVRIQEPEVSEKKV
jgi:hypothetical protein